MYIPLYIYISHSYSIKNALLLVLIIINNYHYTINRFMVMTGGWFMILFNSY